MTGGRERRGHGFDRIKPPERRLLERESGPRLDAPGTDRDGRAALFTAASRTAAARAAPAGRERSEAAPAGDRRAQPRPTTAHRPDAAPHGDPGTERHRATTHRPDAAPADQGRSEAGPPDGVGQAQADEPAAPAGRRDGRLQVHCSRCGVDGPLDVRTAVRAALPLVLVNPLRDHPVFAICPACRHRAWLQVRAS